MLRPFAVLSLTALSLAGPAAADETAELAYNTHCRQCHSMKPADNRLGPSLHGIVGKEAGTVAGFANYSGALTGFKWDEATIDKFIENPAAVASSTNMQFPGVKDPETRKLIISFLKTGGATSEGASGAPAGEPK